MISAGIDKKIKRINQDLDKTATGDLTVQFYSKGKDELHSLICGIQCIYTMKN